MAFLAISHKQILLIGRAGEDVDRFDRTLRTCVPRYCQILPDIARYWCQILPDIAIYCWDCWNFCILPHVATDFSKYHRYNARFCWYFQILPDIARYCWYCQILPDVLICMPDVGWVMMIFTTLRGLGNNVFCNPEGRRYCRQVGQYWFLQLWSKQILPTR